MRFETPRTSANVQLAFFINFIKMVYAQIVKNLKMENQNMLAVGDSGFDLIYLARFILSSFKPACDRHHLKIKKNKMLISQGNPNFGSLINPAIIVNT